MDQILGTLAFALLIGGQFLAAIVLASTRETSCAAPNERVPRAAPPTMDRPRTAQLYDFPA
jgi:hypothetical protein